MYHIGICDDGKNFCASMEEMILHYTREKEVPVEIKIWYTGEGLLDYWIRMGILIFCFWISNCSN